jgi:hypothetical protein
MCVHMCMFYVCTHVYTCVHMCVFMCVHMCVFMCVHMCAFMCVQMCAFMCVTFMCLCVCLFGLVPGFFQASAQMPPRGIYSDVTLPYLMCVHMCVYADRRGNELSQNQILHAKHGGFQRLGIDL